MVEKKEKRIRWFWEKEPKKPGILLGLKLPDTTAISTPLDVKENEKEIVVKANLPGFKKDQIKLVVTSKKFELSAEKKHEEVEQRENFYRRGAANVSVHRTFNLPVAVDADHVSAKLEQGILTVTMPKLDIEKKKKKSVEIE